MVSKERKLIIDNEARQQLQNAYAYIKKDLPQNAQKVKNKILTSIRELISNPEVHMPDSFRLNNDSSYRAYEIYNYSITYHISQTQIRVIRIRHSRMNPFRY